MRVHVSFLSSSSFWQRSVLAIKMAKNSQIDVATDTMARDDDEGPDSPGGGFVLVSKPMLTVKQFTEWMQQVQLPSADMVMRGGTQDDVVYLLVNRRTFINDALRAFRGSISQHGGVAEETWPALWQQFQRDFPRESISIDGTPLDQELPFDDALLHIREFVSDTLPDSALRRTLLMSSASPSTTGSNGSPAAALTSAVGSAVRVITAPAVVVLSGLGKLFAGVVALNSPSSPGNQSAAVDDTATVPLQTRDDVVDTYTRLVVLLSQQAVLALPLEMVHAQFCHDIDSQLFVGELSRDDPSSPDAGMRVQLSRRRGATGALLTVAKLFRVFALVDSRDYTLFYIDMKLEFDMYSDDDNIAMVWNIIPAGKSVHPPANEVRSQNQAFVDAPRRCDCLGGPAGYHKAACVMASER